MRAIDAGHRFKRDYRRERRSDPSTEDDLRPVLDALAGDRPLEARHRDHGLAGAWRGFRDCHVRPDLELARLGSHAELFA
jgi:mRNA interferase YafQ